MSFARIGQMIAIACKYAVIAAGVAIVVGIGVIVGFLVSLALGVPPEPYHPYLFMVLGGILSIIAMVGVWEIDSESKKKKAINDET